MICTYENYLRGVLNILKVFTTKLSRNEFYPIKLLSGRETRRWWVLYFFFDEGGQISIISKG